MAVTPSIVSKADLDAASAGNTALRTMLDKLTTAANAQARKTGTSGQNPPRQSAATVSYSSPFYVVTITDPGGITAASLAQAAAANPLGSSSLANIYHQVQAATSLLFDAASNVVTYGGDTGNLQSQFVLGDLNPARQWFFRIRTSYDGVSWNTWKVISRNATVANPFAVSRFSILGGSFATVTLPGAQTVGFGFGQVASGQIVETGGGVLLNDAIGLAGPSGVNDTGHRVGSIQRCDISGSGVATLTYWNGGTGSGSYSWAGALNFLTFGFAAGNQNLSIQTLADGGKWVILTLSGGTQIAIGQGVAANGATVQAPAGFSVANSFGVATPALGTFEGNLAHGIRQSTYTAGVVTILYGDGSGNSWPSTGNWFAVAWPATLAGNVRGVAGGQYLILPTPSGNVALGVGSTPSGGVLPLPAGGYTYSNCLAFSTPGSYNDIGSYMHGIKVCAVDVGLPSSQGVVTMIYTDGTEAVWDGNANWFSLAWL